MASHHVVGDSPFMKRVLIPFWVVRIFVMAIDIIVYALAIAVIAGYKDNVERLYINYNTNISFGAATAILVVMMLIILFCLILDIVCIVKRARRTLSPRFFLIVNVIQVTIWTILFVLSMLGARTGVSITISVIIYLSFIGLLIYASVIFHRQRKGTLRGTYVPANNPSEYNQYAPQQSGYVQNTGYPSYGNAPYGADYSDPSVHKPAYSGYNPHAQGQSHELRNYP